MGQNEEPSVSFPYISLPIFLELTQGEAINAPEGGVEIPLLPPTLQKDPEASLATFLNEVLHCCGREKVGEVRRGPVPGPAQCKGIQFRGLAQGESHTQSPPFTGAPTTGGPLRIPFIEPLGDTQTFEKLMKAQMGPLVP